MYGPILYSDECYVVCYSCEGTLLFGQMIATTGLMSGHGECSHVVYKRRSRFPNHNNPGCMIMLHMKSLSATQIFNNYLNTVCDASRRRVL